MERSEKDKLLLIVDDNKINRMAIRILLDKNEFIIEEADDGIEVITLIKNKEYDIIFLDVEMPIVDGIQCTEILRNELEYKGMIIGITSHVDYETFHDCIKAGMNDVIMKPITEKSIIECIKNNLNWKIKNNRY